MSNYKIRVKKDKLNEHLLEKDYELLDFLEKIDLFETTIDTLSNFSILNNYEIQTPIYLSALKILKSKLENPQIIVKNLPFNCYEKGYKIGLTTDIKPGIEITEYQVEIIITIFKTNIEPFGVNNNFNYYDQALGYTTINATGFCMDLWCNYGFQIGKEKQSWDIIKKSPDPFISFLTTKQNDSLEEISLYYKINKLIEIKRILQNSELNNENSNLLTKSENPKDIFNIQNNFDGVNIIDIYNHFKTGLVDKNFLSDSELIDYLNQAFEQNSNPKTRFKIKNAKTKQIVIHVFYEYYKNVACKPHGKQKKYAALLGEYFEGYNTNNVSSNFNK